MSNYRRGYNWENIHYIPAPTGGWNPDVNPWELPQDQAPVLDNFLIRPGHITIRGAFQYVGSTGSSPQCGSAFPIQQDQILVAFRDVTAGTVEHWNAPLAGPISTAIQAKGLTTMAYVNTTTGTVTNLTVGARDQIIGPRSINFRGTIYALSYDSASPVAQDVSLSYFVRPIALLALKTPPDLVTAPIGMQAPTGAFDLKGYQSRIWLLGGIDTPAGGTTHSATTLFFTNPGAGTVYAAWQDPVSGLTNKITLDDNYTDYGVGLAVVRGGLLIFRRNSIWILRGSTTASYVAQPISKQSGCCDARSIVEVDNGVYYISRLGLMFTDGTRVQNVSGNCMYTLQQAIALEQNILAKARSGLADGSLGYITCAPTSQGQIVVTIGTQSPAGVWSPIWAGMFDINTRAWSRITSPIFGFDSGNVAGNSYPTLVTARHDPPKLFALGEHGLTRMEDTALGASFLQPPYSLYDNSGSLGGGNPFLAIPAIWKSRYAPLIGTTALMRKYGLAKRYFLDYLFGAGSLTPSSGWSVKPVDATDTQYANSTAIAAVRGATPGSGGSVSGASLVPNPAIQRQSQDFTNEIGDLGFDLSWSDSARAADATNVIAEVHGVGVEYQPTRDLR